MRSYHRIIAPENVGTVMDSVEVLKHNNFGKRVLDEGPALRHNMEL